MMEVIVVGSGPAGIAAAKGLLERNCRVTLLDVGYTLGFNKNALLNNPSLRHHANARKKNKLPYGSNFIYKGVADYFSWTTKNCYFQPSFARGGLINAWGGSISEYSAQELINWPSDCRNKLPLYYSQMIQWMGQYYTNNNITTLSQQAVSLYNIWNRNQAALAMQGFSFQVATLALDFMQCRTCGLCQYGCPYELIYNSAIHLESLKLNNNFQYIPNVVVENFFENDSQVEIVMTNVNDKSSLRLFSKKLFIACGAGMSSLLYLRSFNKFDKKLILKDSQHFVLPCLLNRRIHGVMQESLHTLCQLKTSLVHQDISHYPVQLQLYTYMDLYVQEIKNKSKCMYPILKPLLIPWIERLVVLQGYLHSQESGSLLIQYNASGTFEINAIRRKESHNIINNIVRYLKQHKRSIALYPLTFMLIRSLIGQSNHVGGSIPMSSNPQEDEVDIWGRPNHFKAIHFVDGSIFPSIPAGPITLTIMANAYRIAKEVPL